VQDISSHKRANSTSTLRGMTERARRSSASSITLDYGTHLCLFVVFDKKAGWIRLADSAVGELELYDVGNSHPLRHRDSAKSSRSKMSVEGTHHHHHNHVVAKWIPPIHCELPLSNEPGVTSKVYLLTWGRQTHIVHSPLRCSSSHPPLHALLWHSAPTTISVRLCQPFLDEHSSPFLQIVAFGGENGLEVQEISLSFLGKGKRKADLEESVRAEEDFGGDIGSLYSGGHWDASDPRFHLSPQALGRSSSTSSGMSFDSLESSDLIEKLKREEGIYGWYRKGLEDWRVFWVGGSGDDDLDDS
jgi:hypothetical protein